MTSVATSSGWLSKCFVGEMRGVEVGLLYEVLDVRRNKKELKNTGFEKGFRLYKVPKKLLSRIKFYGKHNGKVRLVLSEWPLR